MKRNAFYLLTLLLAITLFTSCEKDEGKSKVVNPIAQATYTGDAGLTLTYDGEIMIGKKLLIPQMQVILIKLLCF
ncbi:hypothetical protein [Phocaeicola oris]|uniref:hypothetical protein n=1 Tax=Phocaeicola oris TaxID=2896850 RepID=UPI00234EBA58|nr:hypothetical protein [Phocaeicola oris]MCE2617023.1 hypothetical protein [Phocaeicola oris]